MSLLTQYVETLAARERRCRPQCQADDWSDEPTPVVLARQPMIRTVCGRCGQWIGNRPLVSGEKRGARIEGKPR